MSDADAAAEVDFGGDFGFFSAFFGPMVIQIRRSELDPGVEPRRVEIDQEAGGDVRLHNPSRMLEILNLENFRKGGAQDSTSAHFESSSGNDALRKIGGRIA